MDLHKPQRAFNNLEQTAGDPLAGRAAGQAAERTTTEQPMVEPKKTEPQVADKSVRGASKRGMPKRSNLMNINTDPSQYTVLLVDDSETDRLTYQRYCRLIEGAKLSFLEADCGEVGLALAQQHQPDLILLDYMLPDFDGLEFLQALKGNLQAVPPVIMLTGEGNEKVAVEAMKVGVRDYLIKGELSAESFSQAIRRVLSQQALQAMVDRRERQQKLVASVALRISQSQGLDETLQAAAEGVRELLDCDRTVIYRFAPDMSGVILAESVLPPWSESLSAEVEDTCFQSGGVGDYLQGHASVIADIYNAHLTDCHIKMLERFEVKANLVVPIIISDLDADGGALPGDQPRKLWGLLIAHHCRATREWLQDELALLDDLAVQLGIAIRQTVLISALKSKAEKLTSVNSKLVKAAQNLKQRNRELDEFAYIASHDLRAPLRAITNLANWLEEDLSGQIPEENLEQIALMQARAKRLDDFISGLLDYSRAGRVSASVTEVDTRQLLSEVIDALSPSDDFEIVVPQAMPTLHTQVILLQQVFSNLVGNAIKYHHKPNGKITVAAVLEGEYVRFSVTDDGPGIAPEYHERIFGMFQTLNSRDDVESTGIGLSVVKKVVEKQGGQISLLSAVGQGSTFSFTWPTRSSSQS